MTLTELQYICALARELHFGRAARACHVSQPTLSVAIRKLEDELGVTLFERGRSEIAPTPIGERLIEQARRVLTESASLRQMAQQAQDPLDGPLRVGAIHTVGPYLFPHLIPAVRQRTPQMPLIVEEGFTGGLSERLRQGALDAIIVALPFEAPGVTTRALYSEPFRVVIPADHRWRQAERVAASELAEENVLLLGSGHCFRDQVLVACPECATQLGDRGGTERALEGSSLETIRHMVASGIGVTVLPRTAVGTDQPSEALLAARPFAEPEPRRYVALAWRESFPRMAALSELEAAIQACGLTGVDPVPAAEGA
jgi:LysR family hydrogen peroxide-inducible transcriptional activator